MSVIIAEGHDLQWQCFQCKESAGQAIHVEAYVNTIAQLEGEVEKLSAELQHALENANQIEEHRLSLQRRLAAQEESNGEITFCFCATEPWRLSSYPIVQQCWVMTRVAGSSSCMT